MSRLIDRLNRVSRAVPEPMGFRTARQAPPGPRIALIASLDQIEKTAGLAELVAGADAVLLRLGKPGVAAGSFREIVAAAGVPCGARLEKVTRTQVNTVVEAGCDFFVFAVNSAVSTIPEDEEIGRVLVVESTADNGLLRAVADLPVDAVLAADIFNAGETLTWQHLMAFQRLSGLVDKPLLAPVSAEVSADDLTSLWEVGVDGVIVAVTTEQPAGRLAALSQTIAGLALPSVRRRGKPEALLPRFGEAGVADTGDEEEDD